MKSNDQIELGNEFEVTVEKLVYRGEGLARLAERVVFIPGSAPGDRLRVRINAIEKRHLRAEIVEIIEPGPNRRSAPCRYFGQCGGCQLQHLNYPAQLAAKAEFIREALTHIGQLDWSAPIEIKHAEEFGYRSRTQFKLERNAQPLQIGFYRAGSHSVCDISECPILTPSLNQALTELREQRAELAATATPFTKLELAAGTNGVAAHPAVGQFDDRAITQQAFGITYWFSPAAFFQVNQLLLESLIETALADSRGDTAIDLYAGVGLFTLQLARRFRRVIASEVSPLAARWAAENIANNKSQNVEFYPLSTERWLSRFAHKTNRVDLVLLDPPRAGLSQNVVANVTKLRPAEVVYVSCDPATLARDLKLFVKAGYQLKTVTGVDLFPQSYHIETVARLAVQK